MTAPHRHEGSCRCGAFRFAIEGDPIATFACHCRGCQKLTSGPYSLTAMIPADRFHVLAGESELGGLHGEHRQHYCPRCKTWLYTRPHGMEGVVNLRAVLLDDADAFPPYADVNLAEALPGVVSGAEAGFAGAPPEAELDAVIAANAAFLARYRARR